MRILHVDSGREMRGGQWQALRLVERLPGEGIPAVLLARAGSPLFARAARLGIDVQPLGLLRLARLARHADLVHAHDARSHTLAVIAAGSRPVVVARRVAFPIRPGWKYRRAAHYIAVSQFVRGVLAQAGVPSGRISVVYDGAPALAAPARRERVIAPDLADAMKGGAMAREAGNLAGVPIHFSRDIEADLENAAVFLYLTHSEGLGSAVLLAMSAGVPVVASNAGGLPEIVAHGRTGLLTENSATAVAAALRRLLDDPALARSYGERGRATAVERFSVERMVRDTIDVYRKVLVC